LKRFDSQVRPFYQSQSPLGNLSTLHRSLGGNTIDFQSFNSNLHLISNGSEDVNVSTPLGDTHKSQHDRKDSNNPIREFSSPPPRLITLWSGVAIWVVSMLVARRVDSVGYDTRSIIAVIYPLSRHREHF
jgi:hypothetical protein